MKTFYLDGTFEQNRLPCSVLDKVLERKIDETLPTEYSSYLDLAKQYLEIESITTMQLELITSSSSMYEDFVRDLGEVLADHEYYTADADVLAELMLEIASN